MKCAIARARAPVCACVCAGSQGVVEMLARHMSAVVLSDLGAFDPALLASGQQPPPPPHPLHLGAFDPARGQRATVVPPRRLASF